MTDFIAYYRVSTSKQRGSGLGLAAQRQTVFNFLKPDDRLLSEYTETESGRNDDRQILWAALKHAKRANARLLIARLDRFSRRVSFIAQIMEQQIGLTIADMPHATDFQLNIFAALAQEERRLISVRTKAALAEAKKRGTTLGRNGKVLADRNKCEAATFAQDIANICEAEGIRGSYSFIARELNRIGIKTRSGGSFFPQTVKNYFTHIDSTKNRETI